MSVFEEGKRRRPTFPAGEEEAATSRETGCLQTTTRADTESSHCVKLYLTTVLCLGPDSVSGYRAIAWRPVAGAQTPTTKEPESKSSQNLSQAKLWRHVLFVNRENVTN